MRHFTNRWSRIRSANCCSVVVRHIAHYPIRMRGTFCGSLAHADPASEWCLVAATLDAELVAKSTRGERVIAAKEFFAGIMSTALAEDELLAEARLPLLPKDAKFGFNEFSRRAGDFAMAASLVTYRLHGGKIADARVGVGGAEPSPRRIAEAEAALNGKAPGDESLPRCGRSCRQGDRSAGRPSDKRRIPARPGTRGRAPRAGGACTKMNGSQIMRKATRAHQRLRDDLGRPRHPAAGGPGVDHRPGALHSRSSCRPLGAFRAQPGSRRKVRKIGARKARWSSPPLISKA